MNNKDYQIDLVVKIGGSCLTDKAAGRQALRQGALDRLAELASRINADDIPDVDTGAARHRRWVLVHGAGSFGHPQAKAACLSSGRLDASTGAPLTDSTELLRRRLGFCATRQAVLDLAGRVNARLTIAGVPAVTLSPAGHYRSRADRLAAHWPAALANQTRALLDAGFAPQLHGDAVPEVGDSNRGWAVLSGDVLIAQLAGSFRLSRAVFITGTGGVFSADPSASQDARLLEEIRLHSGDVGNCPTGIGGVGGAAPGVADVTGGMGGKLGSVAGLLLGSRDTDVRVCGWDDAVAACLTGGGGGTRVTMID